MSDVPNADHEPLPTRKKRVPLARAFRGLRRRIALYRTLSATVAVAFFALAAFTVVQLNEPPEPIPLGTGKAGVKTVDLAPPSTAEAAPSLPERTEGAASPAKPLGSGHASYYGDELAGNPTASGERFDPSKMTAAHRTLPLGSRVRVTNTRTGEAVIVRINDRGPFHGQRVIDVSKAAARKIGMLRAGTARVKLELLPQTI